MNLFTRGVIALLWTAGTCGTTAIAQNSITIFGQPYRVQRFNYSDQIKFPGVTFPADNVAIFESEGLAYIGNNKLIMSADDVADVFIGEPDNWFIEVNILTSGGNITGLQYSRTLAVVDAATQGYDPNPGGLAINTSNTGLGAGGNLVVSGNDGYLYAYGISGPTSGQLLQTSGDLPCPTPAGCSLDISIQNFNAEDLTFVPPLGTRPPAFYVINQDLGGLDIAGVERWSTAGTLLSTFAVGGTVAPSLEGAVAKGIAYIPDSPKLPALLRRPDGIILVSFDRAFPALQAFDIDGNLIATEILTVNGRPNGAPRLDMSGCSLRMHIESLAADPATGRLFLSNQGNFLSCNYMWILSPSCGLSDVAGPGQSLGSDGQLTADDIIVFLNWFFASDARADVAGPGQNTTPDTQFTADDIIVFLNRFFAGC